MTIDQSSAIIPETKGKENLFRFVFLFQLQVELNREVNLHHTKQKNECLNSRRISGLGNPKQSSENL